jgi:hypothetical protein
MDPCTLTYLPLSFGELKIILDLLEYVLLAYQRGGVGHIVAIFYPVGIHSG